MAQFPYERACLFFHYITKCSCSGNAEYVVTVPGNSLFSLLVEKNNKQHVLFYGIPDPPKMVAFLMVFFDTDQQKGVPTPNKDRPIEKPLMTFLAVQLDHQQLPPLTGFPTKHQRTNIQFRLIYSGCAKSCTSWDA